MFAASFKPPILAAQSQSTERTSLVLIFQETTWELIQLLTQLQKQVQVNELKKIFKSTFASHFLALTFQIFHSSDICSLRLDFDTFNILGPDGTDEQATNGGSCARDSFTVTVSRAARKY